MKKVSFILLIAIIAILTGCKKEESYSVEFYFSKVGDGVFTVYYSLKGVSYTVNDAPDGWITTISGKTGDYASISCTPPSDGTSALVRIRYNGQAIDSDYQEWPSTSSASGTLP